ncbi:MAG TPA: cytochrome P450 [Streptosporangiaceae bacterium]
MTSLSVQASPARVAGPSGRQAPRVLASMFRSPLDGYIGLAARYGDTIRMPTGPRSSFFLLSRPEQAEHVLASNQDNYVKAFTYRPLRALIGDGLLTSEGETWRRQRRLMQPLFARRDVQLFGPTIADCTQRMLAAWDRLPDASQVDVSARMGALALEVIGHALFGTDLTGETNSVSAAMAAGQKVATLAAFLPLPSGPRSDRAVRAWARRVGHAPEGIDGPVARLIAGRRAAPDSAADGASRRNLLDVLLTARRDDGSLLLDEEIAAEVTTFMLAGHETSANTLSWAFALLSAFPQARQRLEAEVDSVLQGAAPAAADVGRLPWVTAVVSEAMRLYPPAWTIERDAVEDDRVAGVAVPAGSLVAVPPYLVHRHPEFWPDPAGFDPERFLPGAPEHPRYAFIPFGGGRRACIGQSFAELETVLVLAAVTQRYRLQLTPAGIPKPTANVTLRPGRLPMRLTRRT